MNEGNNQSLTGKDLARKLPMFSASDPEALAKEKAELAALQGKGLLQRWGWYFQKTGPGWMQSALVLGSGSAMGSLFAGAFLEYRLLWVQPVAMLLGIIIFAAISYQTLSTGARPFQVVRKFIHPSVAWLWLVGAMVSTLIWHIPQYALAAGMTDDIIKTLTGWQPTPNQQVLVLIGLGLMFLALSTAITWGYSSGYRGIRIYEQTLKALVWMITIAFAMVVIRATINGRVEWGRVLKGFIPMYIPTDKRGIAVLVALLGAATGVNATFLFPYTLLARGWDKQHRTLSRFDLVTGMFLPFSVITSLIVISAGCTLYGSAEFGPNTTVLSPVTAASMLQQAGFGMFLSRIVFGFGVLGMALSTITMHMLLSGFVACEIFGVKPGSWGYRLSCLMPAPGIVGVILWKYMGPWVAVPASAICGVLIPIAYIIFFILHNKKSYLGDDKPIGAKAVAWNVAMLVAITASMLWAGYYVYSLVS